MTRWLIVGHGSVGSALVRRLNRAGVRPAVYDPAPRLTIVNADHLTVAATSGPPFDVAISCVVPSAALDAVTVVRPLLGPASLYVDWNTLPPEAKRAIADVANCPVVDAALLDTLDDESAEPSVAVSGPEAVRAAQLLTTLGLRVDIAGPACGDAAKLKLARSLFMKSLEGLVVEFEAAIAELPGRDIVVASIERNVGGKFMAFARVLLETDRVHARRRSIELQEAVRTLGPDSSPVIIARAAIGVLAAAADAWQQHDAPAPDAGARNLALFLAERLGLEGRRTTRH